METDLTPLYGSARLAATAHTYAALIEQAVPYARIELAWLKQSRHVTNEPAALRNLCAEIASRAMMRGVGVEEVVAAAWSPRKVAA